MTRETDISWSIYIMKIIELQTFILNLYLSKTAGIKYIIYNRFYINY